MTWVSTIVTVGTTAAGALAQNKAQRNARSMQQQAIDAAGTRPEIASYEPVDLAPVNFQGVQKDSLQGNFNMLGLIQQLMQGNSAINQATSRSRANAFSPDLWNNVGTTAGVARDYLQGRPSWSDATEAVARSTGLTGAVGTPGTGQALTARDLGLMDMDVRTRGAQLAGQAIQQGEALDPRAAYGAPQDWQITPREAIPWKINENLQMSRMAIDQAENKYVSTQSGYNIAAGVDPAKTAALSMQGAADQGVNWQDIISGLGNAYGAYKGLNTGGTYASGQAAAAAAPYASGFSRTASGGYVPRAALA
jgi:hypothetical protein